MRKGFRTAHVLTDEDSFLMNLEGLKDNEITAHSIRCADGSVDVGDHNNQGGCERKAKDLRSFL